MVKSATWVCNGTLVTEDHDGFSVSVCVCGFLYKLFIYFNGRMSLRYRLFVPGMLYGVIVIFHSSTGYLGKRTRSTAECLIQ